MVDAKDKYHAPVLAIVDSIVYGAVAGDAIVSFFDSNVVIVSMHLLAVTRAVHDCKQQL